MLRRRRAPSLCVCVRARARARHACSLSQLTEVGAQHERE